MFTVTVTRDVMRRVFVHWSNVFPRLVARAIAGRGKSSVVRGEAFVVSRSVCLVSFTAGEPDMVLVLTMPEQKQAVAYAFAITRKLGVRTTTLPAFDPSEMEDVFHVAPKVGDP